MKLSIIIRIYFCSVYKVLIPSLWETDIQKWFLCRHPSHSNFDAWVGHVGEKKDSFDVLLLCIVEMTQYYTQLHSCTFFFLIVGRSNFRRISLILAVGLALFNATGKLHFKRLYETHILEVSKDSQQFGMVYSWQDANDNDLLCWHLPCLW